MTDVGNFTIRVQGQGWSQVRNDIARVNGEINKMSNGQKAVQGLATRFVGLQALVTLAMRSFRELKQWVSESITEFRDFEVRMTEVSTILQSLSYEQLPALTAGVNNLSVKFGQSAKDLANGLYDILSAAVPTEDAMRLLNVATEASIAGLTTVSISVDVFTSILNSYGKEVSQAVDISDVLFQTVVRGKLRFEDLASAMGYITPIAANAGVAFEEVAAALATVTRQGLHVDMASRGLALLIQGIVDPTEAAANAAAKYGVEMSGLALRIKGLKGFMDSLSEAASEYGMGIIPQIVRNMRSLRVAMALAGEEGLAGFTEDIDLMATASGRADEALTKMMDTQQRQAQILATSMDLVERKIGEAWSGVDIWWQKSRLWWATLVSGGDATKALDSFDTHIRSIKRSMLELMMATDETKSKGTLSDILLGSDNVSKALSENLDVEGIRAYFSTLDKQAANSERINNLEKIKLALEIPDTSVKNTLNIVEAIQAMADRQTDPFHPFDTRKWALAAEEIEFLDSVFAEINPKLIGTVKTFGDLENITSEVKSTLGELSDEAMALDAAAEELRPSLDHLDEVFATLSQSIDNHKLNILELQNAIEDLKVEVEDTYTALSGQSFNGKLEYELAVKMDETKLDRFKEFSDMAKEYGTEYMDKYIEQYGALDNEIAGAISTIYQYNQAVEAQKKAEAELQKVLDENLLKMRQYELEKMKIQLAGMMRRRGNTRMEEKIMKKIDIETMKLRIENMQKEVEAEEDAKESEVEIMKDAYDQAEAILQEYIDKERHNLWLLKDIRDDEIEDLKEHIQSKREQLQLYTQWYNEELVALENEYDTYHELMQTLADDMPDIYAQLFDTTAIENSIAKMKEYYALLNNPPKSSGSGGGGGGSSSGSGGGVEVPSVAPGTPYSKPYDAIQKIQDDMRNRILGSYASGTDYVPQTGLYQLHRGEKVVPANENINSGNVTINITVNSSDKSDKDVARAIAMEVKKGLIDARTGKTRYGMR